MHLQTLLREAGLADDARTSGARDVDVTALAADSRRVRPGSMFVAIEGLTVDGHDFVPRALDAGAVAVVAHRDAPADLQREVAWVHVRDTGPALGQLAGALHRHPSRDMTVMAVTGTNGKTTVAWILDQLLTLAGRTTGLLGTVEVRFAGVRRPSAFTTPLAHELHALLADMRDHGCTHVVLEASSHGLAMHRLAGVDVAVGGFTNLTRDHIDFHGTVEAYRDAKARLFQGLARAGCFNVDDATGGELATRFDGAVRTVSVAGHPADLSVEAMTCTLDGCEVHLRESATTGDAAATVQLPLVGRHNVENALVAVGMAELAGVSRADALAALAHVQAAPGRLEPVPGARHVLVDYAHTPDALRNVLQVLRPLVEGRLICVFGAGGDRDKGKRPQMGAAVAELAHVPFVTSDNPRTEDPDAIIADVVAGISGDHLVEPDRRDAIFRAVAMAGPDDLVLIAGKGHEDYQIIGRERRDFDDRRVAAEALAALGGPT